MTASIIGVNVSYLALTFLPPLLWLLFYLREDRHPEPKLFLILTFLGGMASVLLAIFVECAFARYVAGSSCQEGFNYGGGHLFMLFFGIALIEEYVKYLPVKLLVLHRKAFDEPVDAMIYMITAALGFAAVENALFILPLFRENVLFGLEITTNRFLGANLLHALSSGLVGFFLARAWFSPRRRHFVALGIIIASVLHAGFNYLVLIRELIPEGTVYIFLLLSMMAVMVFIDFERLKRNSSASVNSKTDIGQGSS